MVENVAVGLMGSADCDTVFSAVRNPIESLRYWRGSPELRGAPLSLTSLSKLAGGQKLLLKEMLGLENGSGPVSRRSLFRFLTEGLRRPLAGITRALEARLDPIDRRDLSQAQIFHSTFYAIPQQVRREKRIKKFVTIYDLIPILYPTFCPLQNQDLLSVLENVNEEEDAILCVSQSTKNDVCDYLKIEPSRVFVVYPAASRELFYPCADEGRISAVRRKYGIPDKPFLLTLGRLEARRNINHAIRCFARLVQQEKIKDLNFVLIGSKGWRYEDIFREISHYGGLKDRIFFTGHAADEDLAPLTSGALAFVYPSFYEGFGLPPLEAMQCGAPVIASNTSSLPEVVGDAGILTAPSDADALCQAILNVYRNGSLREELSKRSMEQAKQFSWEKTTQSMVRAYRASLGNDITSKDGQGDPALRSFDKRAGG